MIFNQQIQTHNSNTRPLIIKDFVELIHSFSTFLLEVNIPILFEFEPDKKFENYLLLLTERTSKLEKLLESPKPDLNSLILEGNTVLMFMERLVNLSLLKGNLEFTLLDYIDSAFDLVQLDKYAFDLKDYFGKKNREKQYDRLLKTRYLNEQKTNQIDQIYTENDLTTRDICERFIINIPLVYCPFHRFEVIQRSVIRGSKSYESLTKRAQIGVERAKKFKHSRAYKDTGFFQRLFTTRLECFETSQEYYNFFSRTSQDQKAMQVFLLKSSREYFSACSADILDNGMGLRVYSPLPILLDQNGTIVSKVFSEELFKTLSNQVDISDCVNIQIQRFRSTIRGFDHYTGDKNRLKSLGEFYLQQMYLKKKPTGPFFLGAFL